MAGTMPKQPALKSCHLASAIWLSNLGPLAMLPVNDKFAGKKKPASRCRFFYSRQLNNL
jgi:hypothetical protein